MKNRIPRPSGQKACKACGEIKPFTEYYAGGGGTWAGKCKACWGVRYIKPIDTRERFKRFVSTSENCWLWNGSQDKDGYGYFKMRFPFYLKGAHRVSWYLHTGLDPRGVCICHHCDNPSCVNPSHLYAGDHASNARDKVERGRCWNGIQKCERNARARLNWQKVDQARAWHREGVSRQEIARRLSVGPTTVFALLTNRTWRDEYRSIGSRLDIAS